VSHAHQKREEKLAKCCWEDWREYWDTGEWHDPEITLFAAMSYMIDWIKSTMKGGAEWSQEATIRAMPDSPGYYLYLILDESGKFSKASRMLMDFVLRGKASRPRRKRTSGFEQTQIVWREQDGISV
jgi:hypothetical protein